MRCFFFLLSKLCEWRSMMTYIECAVCSIASSPFRCELVIKYCSGLEKALFYADSTDLLNVEGGCTIR